MRGGDPFLRPRAGPAAGSTSPSFSSAAIAFVSSASFARLRSSCAISSSKPSMASISSIGTYAISSSVVNPSSTNTAATSSSICSASMNSRHELRRLLLLLRCRVFDGHDVERPAGELAREPHVLTAATDRLREVVLRDCDVHRVRVFVDHDRRDFCRRHRVDRELRRVVVPQARCRFVRRRVRRTRPARANRACRHMRRPDRCARRSS